jgi:hypothetical protein
MKTLLGFLLLSAGCLSAQQPKITDCFKVQSLIKMDDEHYWANWKNTCPYIIDSVYVLVGFEDRAKRPTGQGVLGLHYITPGTWRVTRLTTPPSVRNYEFVSVRKITTDSDEALHQPAFISSRTEALVQ